MNRDYKEFARGEWYHVFNRGNGKADIFRDSADYSILLDRLSRALGLNVQGAPLHSQHKRVQVRVESFKPNSFSIGAYCLMPNHFHLLVQQVGDIPVSKLLLKVLTSYSMYFNRKYDHVGHVFQDRFKAVHIADDTQLLHVSAYIHQNPRVAGLVRSLQRWPHSSYPAYLRDQEGGICNKKTILEQFKSTAHYVNFVEESFDDIKRRKEVRELMLDEV